jgi:U4/U6 small nuclear ribonucleoprotein PRP4
MHQKFASTSSQIGDDRPLPSIRLSPDASLAITGSWTGVCKVWDTTTCVSKRVLKGHKERVTGVAFHPAACVTQSASALNAASCAADCKAYLWNLQEYA